MFNVFMKTRLGLAASHIIGKSILFEKYFPKIIIHFINIYLLYEYKVYACTYISRGNNTFFKHYNFFFKIVDRN